MTGSARISASSLAGSLLVITGALLAFGLVAVASATTPFDRFLTDRPFWQTPFGRQAIFAVAGIAMLGLSSHWSVRALGAPRLCGVVATALLGLTLLVLGITLVPGFADPHRGSQRWLSLTVGGFPINIQPSELAKISLILFVSYWFGIARPAIQSFTKDILPPAVAVGSLVALVGMEDFGTAFLLALVGGALIYAGGCRYRDLIPLGLLGGLGLLALLLLEPYRLERLKSFTELGSNPRGLAYQPFQSLVSIAAGGWEGAGLGAGIQKYGYVPDSHTDFVFAIICEEMGFLGAGLVLAMYGAFLWLGVRTLRGAASAFERLLAFGVTSLIVYQAVFNLAVVTAMAPTKGISLPFISAGGSGTIAFCIAAGILIGVAARSEGSGCDPIVA
jgi:cell division protein FtsW